MGRVIVGAVLGAILCGVLASFVEFPAANVLVLMPQPTGVFRQHLDLANILHYLCLMMAVCTGGIIGAIAGAVSANPTAKPFPVWAMVALAMVLLVALLLGVSVYYITPVDVHHEPHQELAPVEKVK